MESKNGYEVIFNGRMDLTHDLHLLKVCSSAQGASITVNAWKGQRYYRTSVTKKEVRQAGVRIVVWVAMVWRMAS